MKCHVCGGKMLPVVTDVPFKVANKTIMVVKELPVIQCTNCNEILIENDVMKQLDKLFETVGTNTELEIVRYAA